MPGVVCGVPVFNRPTQPPTPSLQDDEAMRELLLSAVLDRLGVDVRPTTLYSLCGAHIVA